MNKICEICIRDKNVDVGCCGAEVGNCEYFLEVRK